MSLKPKVVDFEATWALLKETIDGVITLGNVKRSVWNDRFTDVYALCVAYPEPLGDRLYEETKKSLEDHVKKLHEEVVSSSHGLLMSYYNHWTDYCQGVNYLNRLFMYLNTQHIKKHKYNEADLQYGRVDVPEPMLEIGELGLQIWKKHMIEELKFNLVHLLLDGIALDRMGESPNHTVYQGVILSFVQVEEYKKNDDLELYRTIFETPMLKETSEYYRREADKLLQENDCTQYMEKVLCCLSEEQVRARKFVHSSSFERVARECEARLVADNLAFLHAHTRDMVREERIKDLKNMYMLLKPVTSALDALLQEVQRHVAEIGLDVVAGLRSGDNVPQLFVESLLSVHEKFIKLIEVAFAMDQVFIGALDKAFASVVNHKASTKTMSRSPELLAKYCDTLLKRSARTCSENEVEAKLSQSIIIFKYIDDKDVFQKFYAKMLAKRLIHGQSMSMDAEETMINKLKQACGYEFTSKLHRMFTDMSVSNDLNARFSEHLREKKQELGISFSIAVLQAGAWPLAQTALSSFAIPQELEKSVQNFEEFYSKRFNGRKLAWLHHLCSADVKLCYPRKSYIVSMSTYQMSLLLPFASADSLTCTELRDSSKLAEEQLQRQLQALVEAKLLLCQDSTIESNSVLTLNLEYSNKRTKFKLSTVAQKETMQQEVESTHVSVEEDRKLYLQAAIVRIMKARKVLRHNCLIQEVINQAKSRFVPNVSMIKKCIESLIDKQYIERTPNSTDEYSYVA